MNRLPLLALFLALTFAACQSRTDETATPAPDTTATPAPMMASAMLSPTADNTATGRITFTQEAGGVHVQGTISGLAPGEHGFHIHENGDCSTGADGTPAGAAGGHFAPQGTPHGAPGNDMANRHEGDLGNITADADGMAMIDVTDAVLALEGANSIIGHALVVHADRDDLTSQPSGNAGGRVACGVISLGTGDPSASPAM